MSSTEFKKLIFDKIESEPGCPLCSLLMDYEFNLLANIHYEVTRNESIRKQIASEGGFCDFHFRQFKKIANYKTSITLLKSLIDSEIHKNINTNINCHLCNEIKLFENELILFTTDLFNDFDFLHDKFKNSNGFCIIHLKSILQNIKDQNLIDTLTQFHHEQIERFKPIIELMNSSKSYLEISMSNRGLVNVLIQKFAGRKTGGF